MRRRRSGAGHRAGERRRLLVLALVLPLLALILPLLAFLLALLPLFLTFLLVLDEHVRLLDGEQARAARGRAGAGEGAAAGGDAAGHAEDEGPGQKQSGHASLSFDGCETSLLGDCHSTTGPPESSGGPRKIGRPAIAQARGTGGRAEGGTAVTEAPRRGCPCSDSGGCRSSGSGRSRPRRQRPGPARRRA